MYLSTTEAMSKSYNRYTTLPSYGTPTPPYGTTTTQMITIGDNLFSPNILSVPRGTVRPLYIQRMYNEMKEYILHPPDDLVQYPISD
jgi:hypothetical protein